MAAVMDRMRALFSKPANEHEYEPLEREDADNETPTHPPEDPPFSWLEYSVFLLLGVTMLWAW
jgi:solute carrier family 29 (equilibrative nucleoside transporter), member 1/2/3